MVKIFMRLGCSIEQTTQALSAPDRARPPALLLIFSREQQSVTLALVISFRVIVIDKILQRTSQRALAEQDQLRKTLMLCRANPSLREGIQIWTPRWQLNRPDSTGGERCPKRGTELRVPIMQRVTPAFQIPPTFIRGIARHLLHPGFIRMTGDARQADSSALQMNEEQHIVGHQATPRENFVANEVDPSQYCQM